MITIGEIKNKFDAEVCDCQTTEQAQDIKVRYLGKSGELTALLKGIKDLSPEIILKARCNLSSPR